MIWTPKGPSTVQQFIDGPEWTKPIDNQVPIYSTQLYSPPKAREMFYDILTAYPSRQAHRIYTEEGTSSSVNKQVRDTADLGVQPWEGMRRATEEQRIAAEAGILQTYGKTVKLQQAVTMQVLGYENQGLFRLHADSHIFVNDEWKHNDLHRVWSSICWLSTYRPLPTNIDEFNGGKLRFPYWRDTNDNPYTIEPKAGQFAVFPSHPLFSHEVMPIVKGYRMALVLFWRLVNS